MEEHAEGAAPAAERLDAAAHLAGGHRRGRGGGHQPGVRDGHHRSPRNGTATATPDQLGRGRCRRREGFRERRRCSGNGSGGRASAGVLRQAGGLLAPELGASGARIGDRTPAAAAPAAGAGAAGDADATVEVREDVFDLCSRSAAPPKIAQSLIDRVGGLQS